MVKMIEGLVVGLIPRLVNQHTVVVPLSLVALQLMDRLKVFALIHVFLVTVGAMDEVPVDKLNQE